MSWIGTGKTSQPASASARWRSSSSAPSRPAPDAAWKVVATTRDRPAACSIGASAMALYRYFDTKDALLPSILGYPLHTHVGIDYVPSLNDLKTAWDFIHFQGFLGYKMSLQFTWQGCDAILAALDRVAEEMEAGSFVFVESDEDIHTAIERRVTELTDAGGNSDTDDTCGFAQPNSPPTADVDRRIGRLRAHRR